jgi:hypothetical protein
MRGRLAVLASAGLLLVAMTVASAGTSLASAGSGAREGAAPNTSACGAVQKFDVRIRHECALSQGAHMFFDGANRSHPTVHGANPFFGTNADAADPNEDLAAGQSETAIAALGSRVVAAWNDVTGFVVTDSTKLKGSVTGVGYSNKGTTNFKDLVGLPNNIPAQQWFGDPTVVAIDANHFIVGSLYLPSFHGTCNASLLAIAVSVMTINPNGSTSFTNPIVAANGGGPCDFTSAFLDKPFLAYDPTSRTLALSYGAFIFNPPAHCDNGEIDLTTATVPADPATLTSGDWSAPIVVAPEIGGDCGFSDFVVQAGSYPTVAPGGDVYVAWEKNIDSNLFGTPDPYVYIMAAHIPAGGTAPDNTVVASLNQPGSVRLTGGFKSLDATQITGYTRFQGQDFPRIAYNPVLGQVDIEWNSASLHPLGDIFLKALAPGLTDNATAPVMQVNDDSDFTLHFLPAVSVRSDGAICSSWYDRRLGGASSTLTDYWGECRSSAGVNGSDFRITTGSTDWNGTGSLIDPNFGDYTDNTSTGLTTYYLWSDGRVGVPNPFADSHT